MFATQPPPSAVPRNSRIPGAHVEDLPNGLRVVALEAHGAPYLAISLQVRAGGLHDPPDAEGLAAYCAQALRHGTERWSEEELSETLDQAGVRLGAATHRDHMELHGDACTLEPKAADLLFAAVAETSRRPTFPASEVDKLRDQRRGRLKGIRDRNQLLVSRAFVASLFRDHPLGRPLSGTLSSLDAVDSEALRRFHGAHYRAAGALLGVVGALPLEEMLERVRRHFGDWEPGAPWVPGAPPLAPATGLRITLVDKQDASLSQAHLRLGHTSQVRLAGPGYFAYRLAAQALGGDFTARFNQRLRVKEGLTYGAHYAMQASTSLPTGVGLATYVELDRLRPALEMSFEELAAFRSPGPRDEELDAARNRLVLGFPFRFETPPDTLDQHMWVHRQGLDADFLRGYQEQVDAVPGEAVRASAATQFPTRHAAELVVVANAAQAADLEPLLGGGDELRVVSPEELGL